MAFAPAEDGLAAGAVVESSRAPGPTSTSMWPQPVSLQLVRKLAGLPQVGPSGDEREGLDEVRELTIAVDTRDNEPVDELGYLLPQLQQLQLMDSSLESIRDLGTSLKNLTVLRAARCGLRELDGIGALVAVEELYLAFNDIWDLTAIAFHDNLQVLDLESNCIDETLQVSQLGTCEALWSLTLTGNPVARKCATSSEYRQMVVKHVSTLQSLDDEPVATNGDQHPGGWEAVGGAGAGASSSLSLNSGSNMAHGRSGGGSGGGGDGGGGGHGSRAGAAEEVSSWVASGTASSAASPLFKPTRGNFSTHR